jgi:hypothetical protein
MAATRRPLILAHQALASAELFQQKERTVINMAFAENCFKMENARLSFVSLWLPRLRETRIDTVTHMCSTGWKKYERPTITGIAIGYLITFPAI